MNSCFTTRSPMIRSILPVVAVWAIPLTLLFVPHVHGVGGGVLRPPVEVRPICRATTYHIWDSRRDREVQQFFNNWSGCIQEPFNLEVRPCTPPSTLPVQFKLWSANGYVKRSKEFSAPWMLFGDNSNGDVFKNTKALPNDSYRLYTTIDDVTSFITFTQWCPMVRSFSADGSSPVEANDTHQN